MQIPKKTEDKSGTQPLRHQTVVAVSPRIGMIRCGVQYHSLRAIRSARASLFPRLLTERLDRFRYSDHHCHRINRRGHKTVALIEPRCRGIPKICGELAEEGIEA